jgi:hypothetical protein
MFNLNDLYDQILFETRVTISRSEFENLMRLYVLPSFNRDYPHARTVAINYKQRFYPLLDLTGYDSTTFLTHVFLIKQDRNIQQIMKYVSEIPQEGVVYISNIELVQQIMWFSHKSNSYTINPVVLFDGERNTYFYELNPDDRYILVFLVMNNLQFNYDDPGSSLIMPSDFKALKAYSMWKITDWMINGLDMSTMGVLDEFLGTVLNSLRNTDQTNLLNSGVSSVSFGGEISISFTQGSTVIGALQ